MEEKKKTKKDGKHPANARVDIDYSSGKPNIKFSYPKNGKTAKQQALKQHRIGIHSIAIFYIFILLWFLTISFFWLPSVDYPTNCSASFNENYINQSYYLDINGINATVNNYESWIDGMNVTCDGKVQQFYFNKQISQDDVAGFYPSYKNYPISTELKLAFMVATLWIYLLMFWYSNKYITKLLLKSKRYCKWFPKSQAEGIFLKRRNKKYVCFKPNDVINNEVIIPQFSNVELDYKTSGDFGKKLKKILVREVRYNKYNSKKKKVGEKKVKIFDWYARFIFTDKPKDGKLEVIFQ